MALAPWAFAPGATRAAAPAAADTLTVPPMRYVQRTLRNGLQVVAVPGTGSATVAVQVWYRVGGKDDPPGRSGFAHLFEHMMFKRTRYLANEAFDRLTDDVGGSNNAFTAEDTTAYLNVVPSNHLERLLWAEAERMAHLEVDQDSFDSERAVVQEELRQRVYAQTYGRLFHAIPTHGYLRHPYQRPVVGSLQDLSAATLSDVRRFHSTYYRPDNAVLVVAGDFDLAQFNGWVDRYFGVLARPATPIPRVRVTEPRYAHDRTVALFGPSVPLPAVVALWQGPNATSRDSAALSVAQTLLSGGASSRLHDALVYRQRVAQAAGFNVSLHGDAGLMAVYAIAAGERAPQSLLAPLMAELTRLAQGPISDDELGKVKAGLLTGELNERQTPVGRATEVGWAMIYDNDPAAADRELKDLQAVRADDVRHVLRKYVIDRPRVVLTYTQQPAAASAAIAASAANSSASAASAPEGHP